MSFLKLYDEFMDDIYAAGFDHETFAEFVRQLPCLRFGQPEKGLLRKLYFAYIGLGEFTLKITKVRMFSDNFYINDKHNDLYYGDSVYHKDTSFFDPEIDLPNLDILSPLLATEEKVLLTEALRRTESIDGVCLANVWHCLWLYRHQELIPDKWKEIIRGKGRIIFPRVRITPRGFDEENPCFFYPYLRVDHGGYNIEFSREMDPQEHVSKNDFFAFFHKEKPKSEK